MEAQPTPEDSRASSRAMLNLVLRPSRHQGFRLLGKMISQKIVKNNAVYSVLKAAWASMGPVQMKDLDGGVMAFDFASAKDRDWFMELSSWEVHGHCLNLQEAEVTLSVPQRLNFPSCRFGFKFMALV